MVVNKFVHLRRRKHALLERSEGLNLNSSLFDDNYSHTQLHAMYTDRLECPNRAKTVYTCTAEMNAMFQGKLKSQVLQVAAIAISVALTASACGKGNAGQQVYKGAMALENVKVGVPETVFKEAILTFVKDPNPAASSGGKTQYVGRQNSAKGGQYLVQCKKDRCYKVQVYYMQNPVTREEAMDTLKQLLPPDTPEQSTIDTAGMKNDSEPNEIVSYGDAYTGQFIYTDKNSGKVKIVNAICNEAQRAAFQDLAGPEAKKEDATASAESKPEPKSN